MSIDITTQIAGMELSNCLYNASGVNCITRDELVTLATSKTGAIQSKSCTVKPRYGNPLPRYYENDMCTINSSGLPNMGYDFYYNIADELQTYNKPYIISVSGLTHQDNITIIETLSFTNAISAIELNLSCPNIVGKPQTGYDFESMDELLRKLFENIDFHPLKNKLGLKLPPYFDISHYNKAAEVINSYKIDFLTCINSIGNGLVINPDTDSVSIKPKNGFGGIGGQCIKPTALANVRKFYELTNCDIVGCGGVKDGRDVYEHILCGAKAVQIGSQFKREGIEVFDRLSKELMAIMYDKGYSCIEDFRGKLNYL